MRYVKSLSYIHKILLPLILVSTLNEVEQLRIQILNIGRILKTVMSEIRCEWNDSEKKIECLLPITKTTSKARIKRRGIEPIAPRKTAITTEDFIEWQISYKDKEGKLIELGRILLLAYSKGIISRNEICSAIEEFKDAPTFSETFHISRESFLQDSHFYGFKIFYEKTPILHLDLQDGCYIEIALKHKQKAVGYQPMIYIYIPAKNVTPNIVGRFAKEGEIVSWFPDKEHILGLLRAFLIASKDHREDIGGICLEIIKSCP